MNMRVRDLDFDEAGHLVQINETAKADWNAYVAASPRGTFFHRHEWGDVLRSVYGHAPLRLSVRDGQGRIVGLLMLVHKRSVLFGNALIATGFTVGGGILADNPATERLLAEKAMRLGEEHKVDYVELRDGRAPDGWPGKAETYAGFLAPIPADEDENLKAIPRKKRADVRKGIKAAQEGSLAFAVDNTGDELETFYRLYAESVRNLGTPVPPKSLFRALADAFGSDMEVAIVRAGDEPVAGLVSFYHQGTVLPYYGGAKPVARRLYAYDYLYWAQMRHAAARGCTQFDFGRSKIGTGAYDYKRHWGFEPQPLAYHYHLVKADAVPDVNPNNPKYRLLTKAWSKLPLAVAGTVGPWLAGQLG